MFTLAILWESFTNGYRGEYLEVISLMAILCGILVIICKNPIVSALFLIGLFLSISCYLVLLGLNFIGLSYLLVYVGAVSILFLFILMLINVRISELLTNTSNSIPLAIIIVISFYYSVHPIIPYSIAPFYSYLANLFAWAASQQIGLNDIDYKNSNCFNDLKISGNQSDNGVISFVTSNMWDGNLSETSHITSIGNVLYTNYSIWLLITSMILLLAMVGSILLVIKHPLESSSVKTK